MRFASILPAFLAVLAYASPNASDTTTSVASNQTCITKYRPTHGKPSTLPTQTRRSSQTVSSVVTSCNSKSTVTTTITPAVGTGKHAYHPALVINPTKLAESCATTTTVSVSLTTVYTGEYNGTAAKRTASPLDRRYPIVNQSPKAFRANVFHFVGQRAINAGQKPVAVDCLEQVTTYVLSTSTIDEQPETITVTAGTPTGFLTAPVKAVTAVTASVSITSTMTAPGMANSTAGGTCTVTAASSTTTQHLKCAPTNLIGEVNGYGIGQTGGSSANTRGLAPGSDPSACCQLCVDDDECAASEDDTDAGNCFLWYTQPSCGLGFQYSDGGQKLEPGSGFLVQTGCGTIEATDSF